VDYRKAFDSVQRNLLWDKLLNLNINGKVLNVLKDMYVKAKSCVKTSNGLSDFFVCNVGLRQGENLSPILFSIFLNDLNDFLKGNIEGLRLPVTTARNMTQCEVETFTHLFLLMYADDTILLAETAKDMQKAINYLQHYCNIFGLSINTQKTKVLIFSRGKIRNVPAFTYEENIIEVVWEYKYLGVLFNFNNSFKKAQKLQFCSANRAMFTLLKKCRQLELPIDIQIELFDKCVQPILIYGSEIWALETLELCDRLQLRFLKILLNLRTSTPNCIVLGEVGKFPVSIEAKCRMLCFWYRLCLDIQKDSKKLSAKLLKLYYDLHSSNVQLPWLKSVETILNNLGLSYIFQYQGRTNYSITAFRSLIKQRLHDQFIQSWRQTINESSICASYKLFKHNFVFENYLLLLANVNRKVLTNFRSGNQKLPVHKQRHLGIPRDQRICNKCPINDIGDEFHYLFTCSYHPIAEKRKILVPKYYYNHPNIYKFRELMELKSKNKVLNLCRFIQHLLKWL